MDLRETGCVDWRCSGLVQDSFQIWVSLLEMLSLRVLLYTPKINLSFVF
jgi:hypothetical protein